MTQPRAKQAKTRKATANSTRGQAPRGDGVEAALQQLQREVSATREELAQSIAGGFEEEELRSAKREARLTGRIRVLKEGARVSRDAHAIVLELSSALLAVRNTLDRGVDASDATVERLERVESRVGHAQARLEAHLKAVEANAAQERAKADPTFARFFALAQPVVQSGRTLLDYERLRVLWYAAQNAARLELPCAEVGTYRGGSAFFVAAALREAAGRELKFHVFDTFSGHVEQQLSAHDTEHHARRVFRDTDADDVTRYLCSEFDRLNVHVGDALTELSRTKEARYGLVHLDVDLYEPTLGCLRHFAPRLAAGGTMVVDDYGAPKCPGIALAVGEFLREGGNGIHAIATGTEQILLVRVGEPGGTAS